MGLAALRVGWLEADGELVREIDKARQPFNVSATSQAAAAAAVLTRRGRGRGGGGRRVVRERTRVSRRRSRSIPGLHADAERSELPLGAHGAPGARGRTTRSRLAGHPRAKLPRGRRPARAPAPGHDWRARTENDHLLEALKECPGVSSPPAGATRARLLVGLTALALGARRLREQREGRTRDRRATCRGGVRARRGVRRVSAWVDRGCSGRPRRGDRGVCDRERARAARSGAARTTRRCALPERRARPEGRRGDRASARGRRNVCPRARRARRGARSAGAT